LKKIWLIRKDEEGVSPVIATILMVAITVVLAAVLYVMVSGLIAGPGAGPTAMGVAVSQTSDGKNWTITVNKGVTGQNPSNTYIVVKGPTGDILLTKTAWGSLTYATHKATYNDIDASKTEIVAGDYLKLLVDQYPLGSKYEISSGTGILASGELR